MKRLTVGLVLILFISVAAGQNAKPKPDLSGTWKLSSSNGDSPADSRTLTSGDVLVIVHHEPEVRVTSRFRVRERERVSELTYYTDRRGETNAWRGSTSMVSSVTKWDGNKLVTKHTAPVSFRSNMGDMSMEKIEATQKWELSRDGKKLIITTTVLSNIYDRTDKPFEMRYVYVHQP